MRAGYLSGTGTCPLDGTVDAVPPAPVALPGATP